MLSAPTLLGEAYDLQLFNSGHDSIDVWLRRRARANQVSAWRFMGFRGAGRALNQSS